MPDPQHSLGAARARPSPEEVRCGGPGRPLVARGPGRDPAPGRPKRRGGQRASRPPRVGPRRPARARPDRPRPGRRPGGRGDPRGGAGRSSRAGPPPRPVRPGASATHRVPCGISAPLTPPYPTTATPSSASAPRWPWSATTPPPPPSSATRKPTTLSVRS